MLSGVPATGRRAEFALVGVIRFQAGKVANEHLYWDQATVLSQLGVLDHPVAAGGIGSAAHLLETSVTSIEPRTSATGVLSPPQQAQPLR